MGDNNSNPDAPARIWQPFIPIPIDTGPRIQYLRKLLEKPEENAPDLKSRCGSRGGECLRIPVHNRYVPPRADTDWVVTILGQS
ncbi:hypothetical protein TWF128_005898 [Orbilia oligospora]|nr:hypothetical protein TWF128_005898 [Orbilia oligospora]